MLRLNGIRPQLRRRAVVEDFDIRVLRACLLHEDLAYLHNQTADYRKLLYARILHKDEEGVVIIDAVPLRSGEIVGRAVCEACTDQRDWTCFEEGVQLGDDRVRFVDPEVGASGHV